MIKNIIKICTVLTAVSVVAAFVLLREAGKEARFEN